MRILVIQPHADDAVWSIGEHMLTWLERGDRVEVFTTHGGAVPGQMTKHMALRAEHAAVARAMGIEDYYCRAFFDDAWADRPASSEDADTIAQVIYDSVDRPDVLVGPYGILHPDHRTVAGATFGLARKWSGTKLWVYEELPYYVLYPQTRCVPSGYELKASGVTHFDRKKELSRMYKSQWADHLERTVFAPERLWAPA